jgi:hypothetical protein
LVAAPSAAGGLANGGRWSSETVRTVPVVVADVGAHDLLQLAAAEDQDSIEAFASQAPTTPS